MQTILAWSLKVDMQEGHKGSCALTRPVFITLIECMGMNFLQKTHCSWVAQSDGGSLSSGTLGRCVNTSPSVLIRSSFSKLMICFLVYDPALVASNYQLFGRQGESSGTMEVHPPSVLSGATSCRGWAAR